MVPPGSKTMARDEVVPWSRDRMNMGDSFQAAGRVSTERCFGRWL
jgi:hypothetical protein